MENPSLLRSEGLTQAIATPLGQFHYERYCVELSESVSKKDASAGRAELPLGSSCTLRARLGWSCEQHPTSTENDMTREKRVARRKLSLLELASATSAKRTRFSARWVKRCRRVPYAYLETRALRSKSKWPVPLKSGKAENTPGSPSTPSRQSPE